MYVIIIIFFVLGGLFYCKPRNTCSLDLLSSHFVSQGRIWSSEKLDENPNAIHFYVSGLPNHHNLEMFVSLKILVACAYIVYS
jgi:hypothetical protein